MSVSVAKKNVVSRSLSDGLIFVAMGFRVAIGHFLIKDPESLFEPFTVGSTNLLIAAGLILMMYPPMADMKHKQMPKVFSNAKILGISLLQNWIVSPLLMFTLAAIFLHNHPEYMVRLILVGIARCIAMILVWYQLAKGNAE